MVKSMGDWQHDRILGRRVCIVIGMGPPPGPREPAADQVVRPVGNEMDITAVNAPERSTRRGHPHAIVIQLGENDLRGEKGLVLSRNIRQDLHTLCLGVTGDIIVLVLSLGTQDM